MKQERKDVMTKETTSAITTAEKKDLLKAAEKKYREVINELVTRKLSMNKGDLKWRWDIGKLATTMLEDKDKEFHQKTYGKRVLGDVSDALNEQKEAVSVMVRFAHMFKEKELEGLSKKNWPWRALRSLVQVTDADDRKQFQLEYEKGTYTNSDAFSRKISEYNEKKRKTGDTPRKPVGAVGLVQPVRLTTTWLTKLNGEAFPELKNRLQSTKEEDDPITDRARERIAELKEQLPVAKQAIADVEKQLAELGL